MNSHSTHKTVAFCLHWESFFWGKTILFRKTQNFSNQLSRANQYCTTWKCNVDFLFLPGTIQPWARFRFKTFPIQYPTPTCITKLQMFPFISILSNCQACLLCVRFTSAQEQIFFREQFSMKDLHNKIATPNCTKSWNIRKLQTKISPAFGPRIFQFPVEPPFFRQCYLKIFPIRIGSETSQTFIFRLIRILSKKQKISVPILELLIYPKSHEKPAFASFSIAFDFSFAFLLISGASSQIACKKATRPSKLNLWRRRRRNAIA